MKDKSCKTFWADLAIPISKLKLSMSIWKPIRIVFAFKAILADATHDTEMKQLVSSLNRPEKEFYVLMRSLYRTLKFLGWL